MKQFSGFPVRMQFTPIPNLFFSNLLPQINDIAELKTTLHVFWAIYGKKGYPRFITFDELISDPGLVRGLGGEDSPSSPLRRGLNSAVSRGTLLCLKMERDAEAH